MIYLCMTMWKSRTIGLTSCITLVLPMVHCDCGTCLVPTDATRKLNREVRHVDNPLLHDQEWATRGARHGRSEDQRAYYEAEGCLQYVFFFRFTLSPFVQSPLAGRAKDRKAAPEILWEAGQLFSNGAQVREGGLPVFQRQRAPTREIQPCPNGIDAERKLHRQTSSPFKLPFVGRETPLKC